MTKPGAMLLLLAVMALAVTGCGESQAGLPSTVPRVLLKHLPEQADITSLIGAPVAIDRRCVWATPHDAGAVVRGDPGTYAIAHCPDQANRVNLDDVQVLSSPEEPRGRVASKKSDNSVNLFCFLIHGRTAYHAEAPSEGQAVSDLRRILAQVVTGRPSPSEQPIPTADTRSDLEKVRALLQDPSPALSARLKSADAMVPGTEAKDSNVFEANCNEVEGSIRCQLTRASTFGSDPVGSIGAITLNDVQVSGEPAGLTWASITSRGG